MARVAWVACEACWTHGCWRSTHAGLAGTVPPILMLIPELRDVSWPSWLGMFHDWLEEFSNIWDQKQQDFETKAGCGCGMCRKCVVSQSIVLHLLLRYFEANQLQSVLATRHKQEHQVTTLISLRMLWRVARKKCQTKMSRQLYGSRMAEERKRVSRFDFCLHGGLWFRWQCRTLNACESVYKVYTLCIAFYIFIWYTCVESHSLASLPMEVHLEKLRREVEPRHGMP